MKIQIVLACTALLSFSGLAPAHAGQIRSPVSVVGFTLTPGGGSTGHLIDQTGLSANFISGQTDYDTYIATAPTHAFVTASNGWSTANNSVFGGYLEFDLGSDMSISAFALWTQNNNLAVNSFTLSSALDAGFTSGVMNLGTFNAAVSAAAQSFVVSGVGEFVRLQINSNHITGTNAVNIGEVAFDTEVLPEPESLAVLAVGLAGLVAARRRRGGFPETP